MLCGAASWFEWEARFSKTPPSLRVAAYRLLSAMHAHFCVHGASRVVLIYGLKAARALSSWHVLRSYWTAREKYSL